MKINRGFTLMELMIVVIIIGILVTLSLPTYYRSVERSRMSEAYLNLSILRNAFRAHYVKHLNVSLPSINDLDVDDPNNLPVQTRYFDYGFYIVQPFGDGSRFILQALRNNTKNVLGNNYYITMNQDGETMTDFYQ